MSYLLDVGLPPKNSVKVIARFTHKSVFVCLFFLKHEQTLNPKEKTSPTASSFGCLKFEKVFLWC